MFFNTTATLAFYRQIVAYRTYWYSHMLADKKQEIAVEKDVRHNLAAAELERYCGIFFMLSSSLSKPGAYITHNAILQLNRWVRDEVRATEVC